MASLSSTNRASSSRSDHPVEKKDPSALFKLQAAAKEGTKNAQEELFHRTAIETIKDEACAISRLTSIVDNNFIASCRLMYDCPGHIVVTAIGKSGNIAAKIAATLSSTGQPAFYLHPSDAAHGDLGAISERDCVLALSNSGETEELLAILPFLKYNEIPMIAITGNPRSTLAEKAEITLFFSAEETCHLGLAPTSSTTAMLVIGDALAMALSKARGFTSEHFALRHPAGNLGRRLLLTVSDLMHYGEALPLVAESDTLSDTLLEMSQKRLGIATIIDERGKLIGVFTDGDLRRILEQRFDISKTPVATVMSKNYKSIGPKILAVDALKTMEKHKITCLPVVHSEGQLIGILHIHDLLQAKII